MFHALILACALSSPGGETTPARADEWLTLDREIAGLATQAQAAAQPAGMRIWGYVRTAYTHGDFDLDGNGAEDPGEDSVGGFRLNNVRPYFEGQVGDFKVQVSLESASGVATTTHALASFPIAENVTGTMGRFKQPFARAFLISDQRIAFVERSVVHAATARFDQGAMVNGKIDRLGWWIAAQNGLDGAGDDHLVTGKVTFDVLGNGVPLSEGAIAARDEADMTVGVAASREGSVSDGNNLLAEAVWNQRPFSVQAEMVDRDEDLGDNTPWSATVGWLWIPDKYEVLARYEDLDNVFDGKRIILGVNRYESGHDVKWQFNVGNTDSDTGGTDGTFAHVGLTVTI